MSKGWKNEPGRHSLASMGIETARGSITQKYHHKTLNKPPRQLRNIDYDFIEDFWSLKSSGVIVDVEKDEELNNHLSREVSRLIFKYWWCLANNEWQLFDFDKVHEIMKTHFVNRIKHELRKWNMHTSSNYYIPKNDDYVDKEYLDSLVEDGILKRSIANAYWLVKSYDEQHTLSDKITWFDSIIHKQHDRGVILYAKEMELPELRRIYEERYS